VSRRRSGRGPPERNPSFLNPIDDLRETAQQTGEANLADRTPAEVARPYFYGCAFSYTDNIERR
jgi:hypothetical protein